MIVILDDGTSFAHAIAHLLGALGAQPIVVPAAALSPPGDGTMSAGAIVVAAAALSRPLDQFVRERLPDAPVLAVGAGIRWLARRLGVKLLPAQPVHGKQDAVVHDGTDLFAGAPLPMVAARYDAWVLDEASLPDGWLVTARSWRTGEVLAVRHLRLPAAGVQFHPHSAFTDGGEIVFRNFLAMATSAAAGRRGCSHVDHGSDSHVGGQ